MGNPFPAVSKRRLVPKCRCGVKTKNLNPPWCLTHQAALHRSFTGLFATTCGAYLLTSSWALTFWLQKRPCPPADRLAPWRVGCDFLNAEIAELAEHFKWKIIADYGRYGKVKPNGVLEVAFQFNPAQPHVTLSGLPCASSEDQINPAR